MDEPLSAEVLMMFSFKNCFVRKAEKFPLLNSLLIV